MRRENREYGKCIDAHNDATTHNFCLSFLECKNDETVMRIMCTQLHWYDQLTSALISNSSSTVLVRFFGHLCWCATYFFFLLIHCLQRRSHTYDPISADRQNNWALKHLGVRKLKSGKLTNQQPTHRRTEGSQNSKRKRHSLLMQVSLQKAGWW